MNSEYRAGLEQWPQNDWRRQLEVQQRRLAAERSAKMAMYAGVAAASLGFATGEARPDESDSR